MILFATGFPGFIAQRLLPKVAGNGRFDRIVLLVEERFLKRARQLARERFPQCQVDLAVGDITRPRLGLEGSQAEQLLSQHPSEWWHLAAIYRLDVELGPARRINVQGTRHVLELARRCGVSRFHYVSTAYVSGWMTGRVMEDDLPEPAPENFKNFYELTKNEAEWLVRADMARIPTVIYRFAVVTGDSRTGETAKFDGPYLVIKYLDRWGHLPLPMIGNMDARINIVPVDYAVEAAAVISAQSESVGQCYQIVDPEPISTGEMFRLIARALGHRPPRWKISPQHMERLMKSRWIRRLVGIPREAMAYINHPVEYDCSRVTRALEGTGISCPPLPSYIPNLVKFYRDNKHRLELHQDVG